MCCMEALTVWFFVYLKFPVPLSCTELATSTELFNQITGDSLYVQRTQGDFYQSQKVDKFLKPRGVSFSIRFVSLLQNWQSLILIES